MKNYKPRAPLSLDPRVLNGRFALNPATGDPLPDATLTSAQSCFRAAFDSMERLSAFRDAVAADMTATKAARELRISQAALKAGDAAAAKLDAARQTVEKERARLAAESLPGPASDGQVAGEIRAALRSMSAKDRKAALSEAVKAGHADVVGSILGAPQFLSGFSDSEIRMAAFEWRREYHPDQLDRMERLDGTLTACDLASQALVAHVKDVASSPLAHQAAAAQEAVSAAETALQANAAAQPAPAE